jgi:hypothetical protein
MNDNDRFGPAVWWAIRFREGMVQSGNQRGVACFDDG